MYQAAIKVKPTLASLEKVVERLEQKRRVHDLSAKVLLDIENMETQQMHMIGCTKENKELLYQIRDGIEENVATIKKNVEYLKARGLKLK
jgi:hypothetical protein